MLQKSVKKQKKPGEYFSRIVAGAADVSQAMAETKTGMEEVNQGVKEIFNSAALVTEAGLENSESVREIEKSLGEFIVKEVPEK